MTARRLALTADLGFFAALYTLAWFALRGPLFATHPEVLGPAIAIDLVLTAAAVHWVFGVRVGGLPSWSVSAVALVGAGVVSQAVPGAHSTGWLIALLAAVELGFGGLVLWRLTTLVRESRTARDTGADWLTALETGLAESLESRTLAAAVVAEFQLLALGLAGVFRRAPTGPHQFTVHQTVGWVPIAGALLVLSPAEMILAHWLAEAVAGPLAAWALTGLTVYSLLWLWGDAQAMRLHPITLDAHTLHLRVGLRWRATIPRARVRALEPATDTPDDALDLTVLGPANAVLVLDAPVEVAGPFGLVRTGQRLALQLDDPDAFRAALGPTT